jgi:hypothetical protein
MDAIKKIDADKKRAEKEAAKVAAKAEKERLKAEAKAKPPEQGFAEGGEVDNDVIPHGDPKREQNLTAFQKNNHPDVPPVAYHGTIGNFNEFSDKLKGSSTGAKSAEMGHWFTDTPRVAQSYAHYAATDVPVRKLVEAAEKAGRRQDWDAHDKYMTDAEKMEFHFRDPENEKRGQNIMPVHLSMKNPHVIDANGGDFNDLEGGLSKHIFYAKRKGHDGLIIKNLDDAAGIAHLPATHYMVFHPHQIKSATGNNGNFDPKNPDITKADGGEVGSPYEDAIKKAKEEYAHVGLRTVEKPITGNISASSVWDDGKPTKEKLNGVSATDVNAPKSRSQHGLAEKDWHVGYYHGNYTYVLGSHSAEHGEDSGEKIMHNPKVVFGGHRDSILGKKPTAKLEGGTVNGYEGGGEVGHRVHFPSLSALYD